MMNIAVLLSKNKFTPTSAGSRFLERLNNSQGLVRAEAIFYEDVTVLIKNGELSVLFSGNDQAAQYDMVYIRGISYGPLRHALARYFESLNIPVVNSESLTFQAMTKLEQNTQFALAGVSVPDSVYITKGGDLKRAVELLNAPFPLVAKSIDGRNGSDNELVHSFDELVALPFEDAIIQRFVPNNFDYRVIVAGDEILASYRRVRNQEDTGHKNNVSQGGTREFVELSADLAEMAVKAAQSIGREFTGVDILTNNETGESVVLEANFNFGTPDFDTQEDERVYYERIAQYFTSLS